MKNTDLDLRIKNTAKVLARFSKENLTSIQSGEVLKALPHYKHNQTSIEVTTETDESIEQHSKSIDDGIEISSSIESTTPEIDDDMMFS